MPSFTSRLNIIYPYLLVGGGILGLLASLILTHDTLALTSNAHYVPFCNVNPVLSCGSVINAAGDKIFGLPYPFYGIAAFAVLIASGVGMLAGASYRRWYWLTFQIAIVFGTIGAYYLLLKSIFTIHALCPFCLSVDAVTTTLLWYTTLYNIEHKIITLKGSRLITIYGWARKHHVDILVGWFVLVIAFILHHFWYYYGKHL
jgi:uncharacterized membrane protein